MRKSEALCGSLGMALLAASSGASAQVSQTSNIDGGIADIVVTAQRREESAQRAPIILNTLTAGDLQGVSDVRELQYAVPGIQFANAGNAVQTYIRGIGSFNAKSVQESAVAYSVDGVYLFTTTQVSPALFDLTRVEVLKGPQGTLYGRNASGGAVNIITQGAKLGEIEGFVSGEAGNYDLLHLTGAVNIPVAETLAVRLAAQHVRHDGYLSDGTSDDDTTAGRLRALWEPRSNLQVKLNVDIARVRTKGPGSVVFPFVDPDHPWRGALDPALDTGLSRVSGFRPLERPRNRLDQWSASAELDWDFGFATFTLLPAYRHEHIDQVSYVPGYGTAEDAHIKQSSLEARLSRDSGKLKWVAGAYYLDVDIAQTFQINNPTPPVGRPAVNFLDNPNKLESWAVFGEATYELTERFRLTGGLRYTWERSISGGFQNQTFPAPLATPAFLPGTEPGDFVVDERVTDDAITWKVGAQYDIAAESTIFATVSRGFKGGGSYVDAASVDPTFEPETVVAYEFGSRNRFFDNKLQVNLEAFWWDIKNQQIAFLGFNSLNQPKFQTVNAANAKAYGGSVDLVWRATRNDTLRFSTEFVKSDYSNFVRVQPAAPIGTRCATAPLAGRVAIDCSGFPMMRTPKWAGSAGYEHRIPLAGGAKVTLAGDMTFASSRFTSIDFSPVTRDKGYAVFNAEAAYHAPDDRWSLSLFGQNLTRTAFLTGGLQSGTINRPTINQPRTYGLRARMNF
ncbi:TonB-dependent receptor [Rhizorhabdus wittichii RW1]|uniref:TonB-dependent receptor n=1 Tax=Rhizorhabdus wittichii (strain DSM 6014 / CCUG 31198 / JCM 15750 / NBRC 105917 / EY 4224 / RW1) TaxID=392499 RepID=A0A9J9HAH1_RHIWR|nr:TonB-dependent receptor [Rhizorhabdus wittichii RW1]